MQPLSGWQPLAPVPAMQGWILKQDGGDHFSFYTDGRKSWDIEGDNGSSLSFRAIMTDQHGDHHGYMILRVPSGTVAKGRPLKIRVTGSATNLTSWYMTFRKPVETGVTLNAFPAILKNNGNPVQLVEAGIFYFGDQADARILCKRKTD